MKIKSLFCFHPNQFRFQGREEGSIGIPGGKLKKSLICPYGK
jgi:hypothetical protein